jgi:hypothetical protein
MESHVNPLEAIGRETADALPPVSQEMLAKQRARFVASASERSSRKGVAAMTALGVSLAAGVALYARHTHTQNRALQVYVSGHTVAAGEWLAAATSPLVLRFGDGSVVELAPGTHARIESTDNHGARVLIERGQAEIHVVHRPQTSWRFSAGPYTVDVKGTAFSLAWDATRFNLAMHNGRVLLHGPHCNEGISVAHHDRVQADVRAQTLTLSPPLENVAIAQHAAESATAIPTPQIPIPIQTASRVPTASSRRHTHTELPENSLVSVQTIPLESPTPTVPPDDAAHALRACDDERLAGHFREAHALLIDLRRRFPHTEEASRAAFTLGVLSLDALSTPALAVRWFDRYLSESPDGSLSHEALGRLAQALEAAGDPVRAREVAQRYLTVDANGPFAPFARSLVGAQ